MCCVMSTNYLWPRGYCQYQSFCKRPNSNDIKQIFSHLFSCQRPYFCDADFAPSPVNQFQRGFEFSWLALDGDGTHPLWGRDGKQPVLVVAYCCLSSQLLSITISLWITSLTNIFQALSTSSHLFVRRLDLGST